MVYSETTAAEQGGFVTILASLTRRAFAMEEPLEYVVYQEHTRDATRQFWVTVHIYGRSVTQERPYRFTGRSYSYEPQAIQLAAREAIVQPRHLSPRVNCRTFYYYPSHEGYGRPPQITNGDQETDPALLHLVHYLRAWEALYDQVTLDLITSHAELARLRRREADPEANNPVVLFGRPIELVRSDPAPEPTPGEAASFPDTRTERDPVLIRLVQYVIAQEHLTQQVIGFLQNLAIQSPQITIGEPLRLNQQDAFCESFNH
ncbi:hypothetical protein D1007_42625 [Hordeum vulgare]|nr:hypothetical protein D1007_42625 [Hordeum vulgare]